MCASIGCVWLLDVAGHNKLTSFSAYSAVAFERRELIKGAEDMGVSAARSRALPVKG